MHPTPREGVLGLPPTGEGTLWCLHAPVAGQMEEGMLAPPPACSPGEAGVLLCAVALGVAPAGQVSGQGLPQSLGTGQLMAPASPGPQVCSASSSVWSRTEEAAPGGKCPCPVQAPATGVELQNLLDVASVMSTPVSGAHCGAEPPSLGKGQKLCGKHGMSRAAAGASLLTRKEPQGSRQPPGAGRPPQGLSETLREGGTGRWVFRARTGGGWPHPEAPVVTYL